MAEQREPVLQLMNLTMAALEGVPDLVMVRVRRREHGEVHVEAQREGGVVMSVLITEEALVYSHGVVDVLRALRRGLMRPGEPMEPIVNPIELPRRLRHLPTGPEAA
jgi:hypothetical protein